jgi:hypothetical protein
MLFLTLSISIMPKYQINQIPWTQFNIHCRHEYFSNSDKCRESLELAVLTAVNHTIAEWFRPKNIFGVIIDNDRSEQNNWILYKRETIWTTKVSVRTKNLKEIFEQFKGNSWTETGLGSNAPPKVPIIPVAAAPQALLLRKMYMQVNGGDG